MNLIWENRMHLCIHILLNSVRPGLPGSIFKASIADPVSCICVCVHMYRFPASLCCTHITFYFLNERPCFFRLDFSVLTKTPLISYCVHLHIISAWISLLLGYCCPQKRIERNTTVMTGIFSVLLRDLWIRKVEWFHSPSMSRTMPAWGPYRG